ncbi:MAG: DMT family transporter [Rhodobacteraceae bacterium]|nr:DMT family transporter [Paracoccaceae bacterium]MCF8513790.1 DMT family transporter [Paracoccaceae bacterium]MCF8518034.1 DMT family transporter [Paracoccaceae bacterium]
MSALGLGLIAAFAWGFHDICVRYVSQKTPLMASLLVVFCTGLLFHLAVMVGEGGFHPISIKASAYAVLAGIFFLLASLGLYGAFQRGPVRLVSPIIASFPILSVIWAVLRGAEVSPWQWAAVLAIVAGVSAVAYFSDDSENIGPSKGLTILYACLSSLGYAGTFAFGQLAAEMSDQLPATLVTRSTAIILLIGVITLWKLPFWPGRHALGLLILMGMADGLALLCMVSAGSLADAQYASVAASVFGLLTIVMAWAFLGERMTPPQWLGCAITFCGIGYLAV